MSGHRWLDDVPAFVLGALDTNEFEAFSSHLTDCSICRQAVGEYQQVRDALSQPVPAVDPPAELRDRVLSAAAAASEAVTAEPDPAAKSDVIPVRRSNGSPLTAGWITAAAAAVLAIWAGWYGLERRAERDTYLTELSAARDRIAQLEIAQVERDSMLAALVGAGVRTATLTATGRDPQVRLFWNPGQDVMLVTAFDLPTAPPGRTYQVWGLAPNLDPVSLGVFDTDGSGSAVVIHAIPSGIQFAQSAVSEEPAGGSPQPTTAPFLIGPFTAGP